jgi:hypothetical protein
MPTEHKKSFSFAKQNYFPLVEQASINFPFQHPEYGAIAAKQEVILLKN